MEMRMTRLPRLDILIYAHDGRGLGHASRSIAVGMAARRLTPGLKVLFVSGCRYSRELIDNASLDWIKLPSYETEVVSGTSRGTAGKSNFSDQHLGVLRAETLKHLVTLYRPRVVLCDHSPQGKHNELRPALEAGFASDTRWVLGVRGVIGSVPQMQSDLSRILFQRHYHSLLWYGDSNVLGQSHLERLHRQFGVKPVECGYVSRLLELMARLTNNSDGGRFLAGTVSIPWLGENSMTLLVNLAEALHHLGPSHGQWRIFVGTGNNPDGHATIHNLFQNIPHCTLEEPSARYAEALIHSKSAVIYGGYNSVIDVIHAGLPALVLLREMQDDEQQNHLKELVRKVGGQLAVLSEKDADAVTLGTLLQRQLKRPLQRPDRINLDGAENALRHLTTILTMDRALSR